MKAKVFWLTGLSGSGKSTVCESVVQKLRQKNITVKVIDGDDVRNEFHQDLGFEFEDVKKNNLLIVELIKKYEKDFQVILVPVIAPYQRVRLQIKQALKDNLYLIYCDADLNTVIDRDVKGLYTKAKNGVIDNMIGFSRGYPYEKPQDPDLVLSTGMGIDFLTRTVDKFLAFILEKIKTDF